MRKKTFLKSSLLLAFLACGAGQALADAIPTSAGSTLSNGKTYDVTSDVTISKTSGKNGLVVASGATVTINIASGCTLTVYGADGSGTTAGKAGILLPSGSTLNVIGQGTLKVYGGKAGNGANGGRGYAVYHGRNYSNCVNFTSYPGSGGNGGGGAGAGIGTDGSNGAGGQSVGDHKYWDSWNDLKDYKTVPHSSCLTQSVQSSSSPSACGTLNISKSITSTITGGAAGSAGAKGQQDRCVADSGSGYTNCDVLCGAGGAGGGGGAGGAAVGYGTGGRGGYGGSCGKCGSHVRINYGQNYKYIGTTSFQGAQGTTGSNGSAGTSKTAGTLYQKFITFNNNQGAGSMAQQAITTSGNLNNNTLTRTGYSFANWNTDANGTGTSYANGASITANASSYGAMTLYAQWTENCITISGTSSGASGTANVIDKSNNTCAELVLDDAKEIASAVPSFTATTATYTRTITGKWGTVCLPYAVSSNASVTYYTFDRVEEGVIYLNKAIDLPAGTPAIFELPSSGLFTASATDVTVDAKTLNNASNSDFTLVGTMQAVKVGLGKDVDIDASKCYYIKNDEFYQGNGWFSVKAYRAYLKSNSPQSARLRIANNDADETAIDGIATEDNAIEAVYSLDGKRQAGLKAGMNVLKTKNGKTVKVMVK